MSAVVEEEVEYDSDPEEATRALAMRRREASEDEEEEDDDKGRLNRRAGFHSDESDGQGGAGEYEDDGEEYDDAEDEEVYDDEEEGEGGEIYGEKSKDEVEANDGRSGTFETIVSGKELEGDALEGSVETHVEGDGGEKKENEPFAVPTAGAFYMHDDRFRDSAGGGHRRTHGGRKLWESKDDKKWGHDKFEEMNLRGRQHEEGRKTSRGRYRSRGQNRGPDHAYPGGSSSKPVSNNNGQNQASKGSVRGRGPRKYETALRSSSKAPLPQIKQSRKPHEKSLQNNSGRGAFSPITNAEPPHIPSKSHSFASSLNSASPPFYPSGSSTKDVSLTQKREVQAGSMSKNPHSSVSNSRQKNVVNSVGMSKLYIDDSRIATAGKDSSNPQTASVKSAQVSQFRGQSRGATIPGQMTYMPTPVHNQTNRVSSPNKSNMIQRGPVKSRTQQASQPARQHPRSGCEASSPPKTALSVSSNEAGDVESPSEVGKSKGALVGMGIGGFQGSGRGSFLYNGAQVMGATGNVSCDQKFPGTSFLPVMQFAGQHPGGMGVPAVGMAFPGYVGQPQLGMGNSEMTWLPVLAGAAGALGATYCSPYMTVDGSYHPRPSGQSSSIGSSSIENNTNNSNDDWKRSQGPELVSKESGQRQNNPNKQPRRYSEMSFSN